MASINALDGRLLKSTEELKERCFPKIYEKIVTALKVIEKTEADIIRNRKEMKISSYADYKKSYLTIIDMEKERVVLLRKLILYFASNIYALDAVHKEATRMQGLMKEKRTQVDDRMRGKHTLLAAIERSRKLDEEAFKIVAYARSLESEMDAIAPELIGIINALSAQITETLDFNEIFYSRVDELDEVADLVNILEANAEDVTIIKLIGGKIAGLLKGVEGTTELEKIDHLVIAGGKKITKKVVDSHVKKVKSIVEPDQ